MNSLYLFIRQKADAAAFCVLAAASVIGVLICAPAPVEIPAKPSEAHQICLPVVKSEDLQLSSYKQLSMEVQIYEARTLPERETAALSRGERNYSEAFRGMASWYGGADGLSGMPTASGEIFNAGDYTAAHRTLAFGSRVRVTYLKTGRSVIVRINDRGPFTPGRIIDLSRAAAAEIGLLPDGVGLVELEVEQR